MSNEQSSIEYDSMSSTKDSLMSVLKDLKELIDQRLIFQINLEDQLNLAKEVIDSIQISQRPKLDIVLRTITKDKDIGIYIHNSGAGSAYIRDFKVTYKGVPVNKFSKKQKVTFSFWEVLLNKMQLKRSAFWTKSLFVSADFDDVEKIDSGEELYLVKLTEKCLKRVKVIEFVKALSGLTFEITYCSSSNDCYTVIRSNWTPMRVNR